VCAYAVCTREAKQAEAVGGSEREESVREEREESVRECAEEEREFR
jgi:hypothetical protein